MLTFRVKGPTSTKTLSFDSSTSTFFSLINEVKAAFMISSKEMTLLAGFPPLPFSSGEDRPLSELGLRSGEVITIKIDVPPPPPPGLAASAAATILPLHLSPIPAPLGVDPEYWASIPIEIQAELIAELEEEEEEGEGGGYEDGDEEEMGSDESEEEEEHYHPPPAFAAPPAPPPSKGQNKPRPFGANIATLSSISSSTNGGGPKTSSLSAGKIGGGVKPGQGTTSIFKNAGGGG